MTELKEEELQRYSRHILLKEMGREGQEKICEGRVLVVGAGGLGSPILMYLAAAGVGTLGIADGDAADLSNLQRQIIHTTPDIGVMKAISAKEKINALNPNVKVKVYGEYLKTEEAMEVVKDYDFVIDATDNYLSKLLINDVCVAAGKPFSHGAVLRFHGQAFTYIPGHTCYRCIFGDEPPAGTVELPAQAGVLGAVPGIIGTIQATEALKFLSGTGELLTDRLLTMDALTMDFRKISVRRNTACPTCGGSDTTTD